MDELTLAPLTREGAEAALFQILGKVKKKPSPGSSKASGIPTGKCEEEDELCPGRKS